MVGSFSTSGRQYTGTGTFFMRVSSWPPLGLSCRNRAARAVGARPVRLTGVRLPSAAGSCGRRTWDRPAPPPPRPCPSPAPSCTWDPALPTPPLRPAPVCTWDPAPPQHLLVVGAPPTAHPRPAPAPACTWDLACPAPAPPQHLLVLGRQTPAAGLQPPVVIAHVLAHLAVLLALLLPPRGRRAVAGGEGRAGHWVCRRAPVPRGSPSWTCTAPAGRASDGSEATPAAASAQMSLSPSSTADPLPSPSLLGKPPQSSDLAQNSPFGPGPRFLASKLRTAQNSRHKLIPQKEAQRCRKSSCQLREPLWSRGCRSRPVGPRVAAGCLVGVTRGARPSPWDHAEGVGGSMASARDAQCSHGCGPSVGPQSSTVGAGGEGPGDSLIWEEFQGPAAR